MKDELIGMGKPSNTAYDDALKTIVHEIPRFCIPLINEMFGEDNDLKTKIVLLNNDYYKEHPEKRFSRRETDLGVAINDKVYHIECESTANSDIFLRMFEYDMSMAKADSEYRGGRLLVRLPKSGVLFLRSTGNTPDSVQVEMIRDGEQIGGYIMPVIKMQDYDIDDIFDKHLYILLPFYVFTLEKTFRIMNTDEALREELFERYRDILGRIESLTQSGEISGYDENCLNSSMLYVVRKIADKHESLWKGVEDIMRGKIIDFPAKRERDAGRREGREEGRVEGRVVGREEGKITLLVEQYQNGDMTLDIVAKYLKMPVDEALEFINNYSKTKVIS
ncbi:MAG: hypothetical protein K6F92_00445 [Lachnospiraceae bacterium]|nr:hypothetical protein [Lachnospiraceae bacterium]